MIPGDLEWRYMNDATWHALVSMFESAYAAGHYTASDVRTAAIFAMYLHETRVCRPFVHRIPPDMGKP